MGSTSVSLDKTLTKKMEIIRNRCYPTMNVDDALKEFMRDSINAKISDEEAMQA